MASVTATAVATRVMVFFSEDDTVARRGLHQVLLERALRGGLAGATIWRGIEGFGASGGIRTARFPDAAAGLPLVLELIDTPGRIEAFLPVLQELAPGATVTREQVEIIRFGSHP